MNMVTLPEERGRSTHQIYDYYHDLVLMHGEFDHFRFDLGLPFGKQVDGRLVFEHNKDALVLPLRAAVDIDFIPHDESLHAKVHNFRPRDFDRNVKIGGLLIPTIHKLAVPPNKCSSFSVEASKQDETLRFTGEDESSHEEIVIFNGPASDQTFDKALSVKVPKSHADLTYGLFEAILVYAMLDKPKEASSSNVA